jgi:hypothetical protein
MATTRVDIAIENSAERVWNVVGGVEPGQLTKAANYVIGCQARHGITETLDGRNAYTIDGIPQGLGRPSGTVADCAGRTAGTGVWQVAA